MIELTKLNGVVFTLNCDLIETIEETPDTTIRLVTKNYHIVKESAHDVVRKVIQFRRACGDVFSRVSSERERGAN